MSDARNEDFVSGTPADRIALVWPLTREVVSLSKKYDAEHDYKDRLRALSDEKVELLLVGAYAMAAHGYPRATMDIDIWVKPSPANADAVLRALRLFGASLHNLTREDLRQEGTVFQIGVAPRRIDIVTAASGLRFEDAYDQSLPVNIEGIEVHIPSISDLIRNKRASERIRDLADAEALESLQTSEQSGQIDGQ
jgi:hypothetical protein